MKWLILFLPLTCLADDWTPRDTRSEIIFQALNAIDIHQTAQFSEQGYSEGNPLIGIDGDSTPSEIYQTGVIIGLLHYALNRHVFEKKVRRFFHVASIIGKSAVVGYNYSVGVRF